MSFAEGNQVVVSRSYYEFVSCLTDHGASQFVVAQVVGRRAGTGRHRTLAVQHRLQQAVEALADTRRPVAGRAVFRRTGRAGGVASRADFLVDLLARLEDARRIGILDFQRCHGRDAGVYRLDALAGAGALAGAMSNKIDQQDDDDNRHQKGGDHNSDKLLRGLDWRLVVVVLMDVTHTELSILRETYCTARGGGLLVWPCLRGESVGLRVRGRLLPRYVSGTTQIAADYRPKTRPTGPKATAQRPVKTRV